MIAVMRNGLVQFCCSIVAIIVPLHQHEESNNSKAPKPDFLLKWLFDLQYQAPGFHCDCYSLQSDQINCRLMRAKQDFNTCV